MPTLDLTAVAASRATPPPTRSSRLADWTVSALRDVAYVGAVLLWSVAGFTILVTGVSVTASLLVLVVGIPIWVVFVHVLRWTTWVDRRLAGWRRHERVGARYTSPDAPGSIAYVRTLTQDPQTWRDMGWLALNSFVGFATGLFVVTLAGLAMAYVSMPTWYWAVSHPHTQYAVTNLGLLTVDTLHEAVLVSAFGVVMVPVVLLLARAMATVHAGLAVRLLEADRHA